MIARLAALSGMMLLLMSGLAVAETPPLDALVGRISMSLGGPTGGLAALDGFEAVELVFRRTVKDSHSRKKITADHRYVELGDQRRIDVRIIDGEGKDSAAVLSDTSWLIVEGGVHEVERSAIEAQMGEFDPRRLWSVPFALAAEGRQILQAASLEVTGQETDDAGREILVMVGRDEEGSETSRLEVDAKSYRPIRVQFVSSSGQVEYRYSDWRDVKDGLVVPFSREFLRNGSRVSRTDVTQFKLVEPKDRTRLFDREVTTLEPVPAPKGDVSHD